MSDLSPETEKLLALARGAGSLTEARRAQIRAGLMAQIAAGGAVGGAASYALWGKAAWLSSPLVKGLSAVALLSALSVGVYVETRPHEAAPLGAASASAPGNGRAPGAVAAPSIEHGAAPAPLEATDNRAADPSAPSTPAADSATPATESLSAAGANAPASEGLAQPIATRQNPSASNRTRASNPSASASASASSSPSPSSPAGANADTLAEETALLRQADQALRAGNAQRALSLLNEDAARFPHGMLGPERAAEQLIARCQLGQIDAKTAQNYVSTHAASPFAARIADACHVSR